MQKVSDLKLVESSADFLAYLPLLLAITSSKFRECDVPQSPTLAVGPLCRPQSCHRV